MLHSALAPDSFCASGLVPILFWEAKESRFKVRRTLRLPQNYSIASDETQFDSSLQTTSIDLGADTALSRTETVRFRAARGEAHCSSCS